VTRGGDQPAAGAWALEGESPPPAGHTPAGPVLAGRTPAGRTPAGRTPASRAPTGEALAGPASSDEPLTGGDGPPHGLWPPGDEEKLQKALDAAYAYLNRRDRTVGEVRGRLRRAGVSEELTEAAIRMVGEQGFLDDARFARLFVSDKRQLEQWGAERIRRGLLARGIEAELAEAALADAGADPMAEGEMGEAETELDRALELLRRRFPDPPQDRRDRNRALGLLLRKGYESELALDALAAHARGD
jgi:regulatory protein